jgi:hypothetical protein
MKQNITLILLIIIGSLLYSQDQFQYDDDLQYAQVLYVRLSENANGSWTFNVTVRHDDSGWDHYADLWIVMDRDTEKVLGSRVLAHPHTTEQPFTRSLSRVRISDNIRYIEVRAKCKLHDYRGKRVIIDLEIDKSEDYEIIYSH